MEINVLDVVLKEYEELLNDEELVKPTLHDKIMIANVREYNYDEMLPMTTVRPRSISSSSSSAPTRVPASTRDPS